jgi:hypothetical protein
LPGITCDITIDGGLADEADGIGSDTGASRKGSEILAGSPDATGGCSGGEFGLLSEGHGSPVSTGESDRGAVGTSLGPAPISTARATTPATPPTPIERDDFRILASCFLSPDRRLVTATPAERASSFVSWGGVKKSLLMVTKTEKLGEPGAIAARGGNVTFAPCTWT